MKFLAVLVALAAVFASVRAQGYNNNDNWGSSIYTAPAPASVYPTGPAPSPYAPPAPSPYAPPAPSPYVPPAPTPYGGAPAPTSYGGTAQGSYRAAAPAPGWY